MSDLTTTTGTVTSAVTADPASAAPDVTPTVISATAGSVTASPGPALADVLTAAQTTVSQLAADLAALNRIATDLADLASAAPRIDAALLALQAALK